MVSSHSELGKRLDSISAQFAYFAFIKDFSTFFSALLPEIQSKRCKNVNDELQQIQ